MGLRYVYLSLTLTSPRAAIGRLPETEASLFPDPIWSHVLCTGTEPGICVVSGFTHRHASTCAYTPLLSADRFFPHFCSRLRHRTKRTSREGAACSSRCRWGSSAERRSAGEQGINTVCCVLALHVKENIEVCSACCASCISPR